MGNYKESIAIIIPALDPDERMVSLVGQLHDDGFSNIILMEVLLPIESILKHAKRLATAK